MGSRMVVIGDGSGNYNPDRDITRAEFAAIVVRALCLQVGTVESSFDDVALTNWYNGYIDSATGYSLITGYSTTTYGPNDKITRERAMKMTKLKTSLTDSKVSALLVNYLEGTAISNYAKASIVARLKSGVVFRTSAGTILPTDYVTRAEVAVMVQRLLQKA